MKVDIIDVDDYTVKNNINFEANFNGIEMNKNFILKNHYDINSLPIEEVNLIFEKKKNYQKKIFMDDFIVSDEDFSINFYPEAFPNINIQYNLSVSKDGKRLIISQNQPNIVYLKHISLFISFIFVYLWILL